MNTTQKIILGIDEVGRGPWAGPLVVGAVILGDKFNHFAEFDTALDLDGLNPDSATPSSTNPPIDFSKLVNFEALKNFDLFLEWRELTDSKQLSAHKRQLLNEFILKNAAATGLGWVSSAEIDQIGLSSALKVAARQAVETALAEYNHKDPAAISIADDDRFEIIIDGTINLLADTPLASKVTLLKKADSLVKEVSAASIIAKVARDEYMANLEQTYPGYDFAQHVGYGTAAHQAALKKLGPCPEHRRSFRPIQEMLAKTEVQNPAKAPSEPEKQPDTTLGAARGQSFDAAPSHTAHGQKAELAVADYLKQQDHHIIAHNFKTKTYEIDLISSKDNAIYFTEVKYRQNSDHGTPLEQITATKRTQMQYAAQAFLAQHSEFASYNPVLAVASVSGSNYQIDEWFPLVD